MASIVFNQEDGEDKLLSQALYVDEDDLNQSLDDQEAAKSGEEYLKRVIQESRRFDGVKTADNAEELLAAAPEIATHVDRQKDKADKDILPSKEWQDQQVSDFAETRTKLARHTALIKLEKSAAASSEQNKFPTKESALCTHCFGDEYWKFIKRRRKEKEEEDDEEKSVKEKVSPPINDGFCQPLLSVVSQLKQTQITKQIEYMVDWCELAKCVDSNQALWFYALMSAVEKPLHPDVESALRSMVLVCSRQRKVLSENDSDSTSEISHLNLLICLVAKYFSQADLSD